MITCRHAKQLFDRHFDGELSPSLQAELHAHQLSCSECQSDMAILSACGDVIAMDRREPVISSSFTDRVMLGYRSRQVKTPRRWGRTILLIGSPMAAAASIAVTMMLVLPFEQPKPTVMAGIVQEVPDGVAGMLTPGKDRPHVAGQQADAGHTTQMAATGLVDWVLWPIVDQAQNALEGARSGLGDVELLVKQGLSDTNKRLVVEWNERQRVNTGSDGPSERVLTEPDLLNPGLPNAEPSKETRTDDVLEAL